MSLEETEKTAGKQGGGEEERPMASPLWVRLLRRAPGRQEMKTRGRFRAGFGQWSSTREKPLRGVWEYQCADPWPSWSVNRFAIVSPGVVPFQESRPLGLCFTKRGVREQEIG